jgi:hypothetical protein
MKLNKAKKTVTQIAKENAPYMNKIKKGIAKMQENLNNEVWDKAICDYQEENAKKINVIEGAIILWASTYEYDRLPKSGDCGVYSFASVACYELQNRDIEDIFLFVQLALESLSVNKKDRDDIIFALCYIPNQFALREWAQEVKKYSKTKTKK